MKVLIITLILSVSLCYGQRRIAVFSGTFDPIHNGHIHNIQTAIDKMDLDEVIISPLVKTPHKNPILSFFERWSLVSSAIEGSPKMSLYLPNLLEKFAESDRPHFTMMKHLRSTLNELDETYHIVGGDTFERIFHRQSMIDSVLSLPNHKVLVLTREGYTVNSIPDELKGRVVVIDHPGGDMGFSSSSFRTNPFEKRKTLPRKVWDKIVKKGYYFGGRSFSGCDQLFLGVFN